MKKLLFTLFLMLLFTPVVEAQFKSSIDLRADYHYNFYIGRENFLPGAAVLDGSAVGLSINNIGVYLANIGTGTGTDFPPILVFSDDDIETIGQPVWNLWAVGGTVDILTVDRFQTTVYVGYVYGNREQDVVSQRTVFESFRGFEFGFIQRISLDEESWMDFYDVSLRAGWNSVTGRLTLGFGFNLNILAKN